MSISDSRSLYRLMTAALAGLSCAYLVAWLLSLPGQSAEGRRAQAWARARAQHPSLRWIEPLLFKLGSWLELGLGQRLRLQIAPWPERAGFPLGFAPQHWLGLSLAAALGAGFCARLSNATWAWTASCALSSAAWPWLHLRARATERQKRFERELPLAMDLCVLMLAAGCDLRRALHEAVEELPIAGPCREELACLLEGLRLGRTRAACFLELAGRIPGERTAQLAAAVMQADIKGTPLVEALRVQAEELRRARSLAAEEEAARVAVRLMFPLLLMLMSLLLIIFGPFILQPEL